MMNRKRAQAALDELKTAILDELRANPAGLSNADLVERLGLQSDFEGQNRNYLSWSILGILIGEKRVTYRGERQAKRYFAV